MNPTHPNHRRRNRLALIAGVLVLVIGGVGVRYLMVRGNPVQVIDPQREAGLTAFAEADYAEALQQLSAYAPNHADDTEAVFALARTQLRLAEDDPSLLMAAVGSLRQVLRNQPGHDEAAALILPVLSDHPRGVEQEGLKLADRLLRSDPDNREALRARAILLPRTGRTDEALTAAHTYLAQHPDDIYVQRLTLDVMKLERPPDSVLLERSRTLRESHPDDPAFGLVEAHARLIIDDRPAAIDWLEKSIAQPPPDKEFVRQQLQLMDGAAMFPQVLAYLDDLYEARHEALPMGELIRRRFEAGRVAESVELLGDLDEPTQAQLILKVLGLLSLQRGGDAAAAIQAMAARPGPGAPLTAELLKVIALTNTRDVSAVLTAARKADDAGVSDPYLDLLVAEAYERADQVDRAITRYESAIRQRPSWAAPCLGLAQIYLQKDEARRAAGYAAAAVQRLPQSVNARVLLAQAIAHNPAQLDALQKRNVLDLIDQVQQAQPGEPRTLALRIAVLAGTGESRAAAAALDQALQLDPPLTESAMVSLIRAAKRFEIDPDGKAQAAYVDRFGQTLPITMVQALRLAETKDNDAALQLFDQAQPDPAPADWRVNRALLLERIGKPEATAAWARVGRDYPDNLTVQQAVLGSPAAWNDRGLIDLTINHLRKLTGEDATRWRVERARWLLTSAEPSASAREADDLLTKALAIDPELSSALALRGRSQRLLGKPREALSSLERAVSLSPENADARMELALAQRADGSTDQALETARTAAGLDRVSASTMRRAVQMMIDEAQWRPAAVVLDRLVASGEALPQDVFTLAQLYRQTQQPGRAIALIESMLETPTPASVALAADLYAQAGMESQATSTLALLDNMDITPDQANRVRAAHRAAFGSVDDADAAYLKVVEAAPRDAAAWIALVGYRLRTQRPTEAVAAARQAVQQIPNEPSLSAVVAQSELIQAVAEVPGGTSLALAILEDAGHRVTAIAAMEDLLKAKRGQSTLDVTADRLAGLAEEAPDFEPLRAMAVTYAFEAGRVQDALDLAARTLTDFPESAAAARLSAEAWSAAGRWREALIAAEAWSRRTVGDRGQPDALIARSHRELGRSGIALNVVEPYREQVAADPLQNPSLTRELAFALAASGQIQAARDILNPLLDDDRVWRMAWLDAAVLHVTDTREAGRWLETVEAQIAAEAIDERAALAQAWWALGSRDSYGAFLERGRTLANQLARRPEAGAALWFFVGTIAETDGDLPAAENAYRRALQIDPNRADAGNNLAMVLTQTGGDLDEAVKLAEAAINASARSEPNYYDTLALIHLTAGRPEDAAYAINQAIKLDPGNPTWRHRLNEITAAP